MKTLGSYIHHDMVPELRPEDVKSIRYSLVNGKVIDHHKEMYLYISKGTPVSLSTEDYYEKYFLLTNDEILRFFYRNMLYRPDKYLKIVPNTSFHKRLHKGKTLYEYQSHLLVKL